MAMPKPAKRDRGHVDLDRGAEALTEAVARVRERGERVQLAANGESVAAVVSIADLRRLEDDDRRRERAIAHLQSIGEAFKDCDPDEIEREAVKAIAEVRAEMYAERLARGG